MRDDNPRRRGREVLFSPVTRKRDDCLVFADEFVELLDPFEGDGVFLFAEVDVSAGVRAVFGNCQHTLGGCVLGRGCFRNILFRGGLPPARSGEKQTA